MPRAILAAAMFCAAIGPFATADELGSNPRALYLRSGTIDLSNQPGVLAPGATFAPDGHYVIQLDGPINPRRRVRLQAAGVRLGEYLPMNAYVAGLHNAKAQDLIDLGFVTWVGPYEKAWRFCPSIGNCKFESAERTALENAGVRRLVVRLFEGSDEKKTQQQLGECGADVCDVQTKAGQSQITIDLPIERMQDLRDLPDVMFVEEAPEAKPRNTTTAWVTQTNVTNSTRLWDMGLHGEGQVAGVIDWNLHDDHCAFADPINPIGPNHRKLVSYYGNGTTGGFNHHGTQVCSVFVGNDPNETLPDLRGMAYEAKLAFTNQPEFITATNLYTRMEIHHNEGARVHNNSWGSGSRDYIAWCRDIDSFTRDYPDDLVLVAITNPNIQVQAPENAKNVLAVAATNDTPTQGTRCFGGFGPTLDGRQKPEVWAPGCNSMAASSFTSCGTRLDAGTSFASPAVGAMALLARQYFMEGFYPTGAANPGDGFTPSGALLKAMVINSAVDMSGIAGYFTPAEGWGRVLMDDALHFAGDARQLIVTDVRDPDGLSTGETDTYMVEVGPASQALKITVVWNDAPAALNANFTPVNNLDLLVTEPGGNQYRGNVFIGLESATGGSADSLNNAEQVHRLSPTPGTWQVEVIGTAVAVGTQGYALVVTGDLPVDDPCDPDTTPPEITCPADVACTCPPLVIDFDEDAGGNPLPAGRLIDDEYAALGVDVSCVNFTLSFIPGAITFDSENPTGNDADLQTPGTGPGNTDARGNVLIIPRSHRDCDFDGLVDNPNADDNEPAGKIQFDFDETYHTVDCILIDTEETGGTIELRLDGAVVATVPIPSHPNNGVQTVRAGATPFDSVCVTLGGSAAIAELKCYGLPDDACDCSLGMPTVEDACDPNPTVEFVEVVSGTCPATVTRTWTATDAAGNSQSCDQVITDESCLGLPGDMDGDGTVTLNDVTAFTSLVLTPPPDPAGAKADTNGDGRIDGEDIAEFVRILCE